MKYIIEKRESAFSTLGIERGWKVYSISGEETIDGIMGRMGITDVRDWHYKLEFRLEILQE